MSRPLLACPQLTRAPFSGAQCEPCRPDPCSANLCDQASSNYSAALMHLRVSWVTTLFFSAVLPGLFPHGQTCMSLIFYVLVSLVCVLNDPSCGIKRMPPCTSIFHPLWFFLWHRHPGHLLCPRGCASVAPPPSPGSNQNSQSARNVGFID